MEKKVGKFGLICFNDKKAYEQFVYDFNEGNFGEDVTWADLEMSSDNCIDIETWAGDGYDELLANIEKDKEAILNEFDTELYVVYISADLDEEVYNSNTDEWEVIAKGYILATTENTYHDGVAQTKVNM